MIDNFEERKTRAGKKMWTFKLEDGTGTINGFCYDQIIAELPMKLENNKFYVLEAAAAFDRADASVRNLVLYNFEIIQLESIDIEPTIDIYFNEPPHSDLMKNITKLLERSKGKSTLKIVYNVDGITYETLYKHKVSNTVKKSINDLIEMSKVEVWN
jgi:DNA polymerase III alpha subunit